MGINSGSAPFCAILTKGFILHQAQFPYTENGYTTISCHLSLSRKALPGKPGIPGWMRRYGCHLESLTPQVCFSRLLIPLQERTEKNWSTSGFEYGGRRN